MSNALPPLPALKTTRYDSVSSFLMSLAGVLVVVVGMLWFAYRAAHAPPPVYSTPVEIVDLAGGGSAEGTLDGTASEEMPELQSSAPSADEVQGDLTGVQDALSGTTAITDQTVSTTDQQFELNTAVAGKAGPTRATGKRPLGEGPGNGGGVARELRWIIRYADEGSLEEYAKQLDFFGIELGAVIKGELIYLSKLSQPQPVVRRVKSGGEEKRLFFTWQGGLRRDSDIKFFQKAGIDVEGAVMFQFVPPNREQELARLEAEQAKTNARLIRRTYFGVRRPEKGDGYEFHVIRQAFFEVR